MKSIYYLIILLGLAGCTDQQPTSDQPSSLYTSAMEDLHNDDIAEAVHKLTYAWEVTPSDSLSLRGHISEALGRCYANQLDHTNAIKCYEGAYKVFCQLHDEDHQASNLYNQASQHLMLCGYDRASELYQSSMGIYRELRDTANIIRSLTAIVKCHAHLKGEISSVRRFYFTTRSKYSDYPQGRDEYLMLSELYARDRIIDSAQHFLALALKHSDTSTLDNKVVYLIRSARLATSKGDYNRGYMLLNEANTAIEQSYEEKLRNSTAKLNQKYKAEIYHQRAQTLQYQKNNITVIGIALLLLTLLAIYTVVRHYKSRIRRADEDLGIAQELAQSITNSMSIIKETTSEAESLGSINFMMAKLNTLIERMPRYEREPHKFIEEFSRIIQSSDRSKAQQTIFVEIIDRDFKGALELIKSRYGLDNIEIEILCMVALGVSNNAIRIVMNHGNNRTIYNYRSSIKSKLNIPIDSKSILDLLRDLKREI